MNKQLQKIKNIRQFIIAQASGLTTEQLNEIPAGYNNNIIWNLGHMLAAGQAICYKRAGLEICMDGKYFAPFLTNTKPENFIDEEEIKNIKELLITTTLKLQSDYEQNIFSNYTKSENIERVYNIELLSIDDALDFLLYHDGYHSGSIMAIRRLLNT